MPLYLLDTNIISDAIRNTRDWCATRIGEAAPDSLCTSIIVAAELRFSAEKKGSPELAGRVDRALASLAAMALNSDADRFYGHLRADLERRGQLIGASDMLIAAHALAIGAVLITNDTDEFSRVLGLRLENWLVRVRTEAAAPPPSGITALRASSRLPLRRVVAVFESVVRRCLSEGLVEDEGFAVDASVVKARRTQIVSPAYLDRKGLAPER